MDYSYMNISTGPAEAVGPKEFAIPNDRPSVNTLPSGSAARTSSVCFAQGEVRRERAAPKVVAVRRVGKALARGRAPARVLREVGFRVTRVPPA